MRLVHCEEGHQGLCRLLIDQEVVPEGAWLDNHRALDEEGEESLRVKVLGMESLIRKAHSVDNLVFRLVSLELSARQIESSLLYCEHFLLVFG